MITDIVIAVVLIAIVGGAIAYICKAKKSGQRCIGCPHSKECAEKKCSCK